MKKETVWILAGATLIVVIVNNAKANTYGEKLTTKELLNLASHAGFVGNDLIIAVAIALAESAGNRKALGDINNPVEGAASYGLWQINSYYHPEFGPNFDALFDPQTNAAAAYTVYMSSQIEPSFGAWSTYNNGAYQKFLTSVTEEFQTL